MKQIATSQVNERVLKLPMSARPVVNPDDVEAPEGYKVEVVAAGLSFPTGMGFAGDGTLYILEGGSTWPTRPALPPRILRLHPKGNLEVFAVETLGGPRGVTYKDGYIYVSCKGGYLARVVRYNVETREREVLIEKIPSGGWHEPGGPVFSPVDGLMYFANGSVSQNGVCLPAGFTVDLAKHPHAHDVPGEDITLTGHNVTSRNPLMPFPFLTETGAFKPFGTPAEKGEKVKGELWCSTGLWRSKPDGSEVELLAWGLRNPYGLAFNEEGELYASDNCLEEKGERSIAGDPDRIWHIRNAKTPHGSVKKPDWYGFPDMRADGVPVWDERCKPAKGKPPEKLIENTPEWAGPPVYLEKPHSAMTKMDFCQSDNFGHKGKLFVTEWGTYAPLNSPHEKDLDNGFQIVSVDVKTGKSDVFLKNRQSGPASYHENGGIERPVDCKFHPDGKSLYVLDFGYSPVTKGYIQAYGHTGVLWKVTKQ
jgi:glucose/arabinose dehydrogenase